MILKGEFLESLKRRLFWNITFILIEIDNKSTTLRGKLYHSVYSKTCFMKFDVYRPSFLDKKQFFF